MVGVTQNFTLIFSPNGFHLKKREFSLPQQQMGTLPKENVFYECVEFCFS